MMFIQLFTMKRVLAYEKEKGTSEREEVKTAYFTRLRA